MHRKTFSPDDIVFRQSDKSDEVFWIVSDKVEIGIDTRRDPKFSRRSMKGKSLARWGLIDDQPRAATARVVAPTEVFAGLLEL